MTLDSRWQKTLAELLEKRLNIGLLLEKTGVSMRGREVGGQTQTPPTLNFEPESGYTPVIAVPRDAAFCFYYPDNLELLEKAGARLHFFSPVHGETLPPQCSGLGRRIPLSLLKPYPGMRPFCNTIGEHAGQGMPIYAECGGLMTLWPFHMFKLEGKDTSNGGRVSCRVRTIMFSGERCWALGNSSDDGIVCLVVLGRLIRVNVFH